jgi:hypothetical protein
MEHHLLEAGEWARLEERLGGASALASSARHHKGFLRRRGERDASGLLRLALIYGPGGQSPRSTVALAAAEGLADLSDEALLKRLKGAADWLASLCHDRFAQISQTLGQRIARHPIRLIDGSQIKGPGQSTWRLHLCFAPEESRMVEAKITPLGRGERLDQLPVQSGEIRIADRGYPQPNGLRAMREAGADVLVRLTWNSLRLTDARRPPIDWTRLFERAKARGRLDMPVFVTKPRGVFTPIPLRLIMVRKPRQAALKARRKAKRASQKGTAATDRSVHGRGGGFSDPVDVPGQGSVAGASARCAVSRAVAGRTGDRADEIPAAH